MEASNHRGINKHVHSQTYVLTYDLAEKVQSLQNIGLKTPELTDPFFSDTRDHLIDLIGQATPNIEVYPISMTHIVGDILSTAQDLRRNLMQDSCIVSTCIEITAPMHGYTIEINRLVGNNGELIGLGPRPGYNDIDSQILDIVAMSHGKTVVIVEDGSFTGSTIVHVINQFKKHGKEVAGVVLGLMFPRAEKTIRKNFNGELIVTEQITTEIIDWMPDHDFFPCVPNCGRVIGHKIGQQLFPVYTFNGFSFSIPYILPYAPIDKWASITDKKVAVKLSLFCIRKTMELFETIEKLNKKRITTKDFKAKKPVVCIPSACEQSFLPKYDDIRILDYLTETAHELV